MDDTEWTTVDEGSFSNENTAENMMAFDEVLGELQPTKKLKLENEEKKTYQETEEEKKTRFLMELEFVQCLANPQYLHCTLFFYCP
jgi:hypothetical protein